MTASQKHGIARLKFPDGFSADPILARIFFGRRPGYICILAATLATCALAQRCPPKPCPGLPPENVPDGTKATLACQWLKPDAVLHNLTALRLYTTGRAEKNGTSILSLDVAANEALRELSPPGDQGIADLYCAAQGRPDKGCQPDSRKLPVFIDWLAQANTRQTSNMGRDDEKQLFKDVEKLIDDIFAVDKRDLDRIHDSFGRSDANANRVALSELLDAVPYSPADEQYVCKLETLRAAYEKNTNSLASAVAAKFLPKK